MSKTVLTEVRGWTPAIDYLVEKYDVYTAMVFGKMWRYCQMKDGICRASIPRMASELKLSENTFRSSLRDLLAGGFMRDLTPKAKGVPHWYQDTGRVQVLAQFSATVQETNTPDMGGNVDDGDLEPPQNLMGSGDQNFLPPQNLSGSASESDLTPSNFEITTSKFEVKDSIKRGEIIEIKENGGVLQKIIDGSRYSPTGAWNAAKGQLQTEMPKSAFDTWVRDVDVFDYQDGRFFLYCGNAFARDWANSRLKSTATRMLVGICNQTVEVLFLAPEDLGIQANMPQAAECATL